MWCSNKDGRVVIRELPLLLTVRQVAEVLGVSRQTAYSAIQRGDLPSLTLNGRIRVRRVDLARLVGVTLDGEEDLHVEQPLSTVRGIDTLSVE